MILQYYSRINFIVLHYTILVRFIYFFFFVFYYTSHNWFLYYNNGHYFKDRNKYFLTFYLYEIYRIIRIKNHILGDIKFWAYNAGKLRAKNNCLKNNKRASSKIAKSEEKVYSTRRCNLSSSVKIQVAYNYCK